MFEQTFKNIDDILHKDAGCSSELDYVEQTSWVLFLKYLDDLEKDRRTKAELAGKTYEDLISKQYRWEVWAAPKGKDGKLDYQKALTGDDLRDFVDLKLFPYLKKFRTDAVSADSCFMMVDYATYNAMDFMCPHCGWKGKGSELVHGDFSEVHFIDNLECPKCFRMVAFWRAPIIEDKEKKRKTD